MAVFRTLELKWKGQSYDFTPSLSLLRRMDAALKDDDGTSNTMEVANACMHGGVNLLDLAVCWSVALRSVNQNVTPDDCYDVLMEAQDMAEIINFQAVMYQSVYPRIDLGKNLKAPSQKQPKATGPRKKATTGQTSTSERAKTSA
jgi:hypothetical protein